MKNSIFLDTGVIGLYQSDHKDIRDEIKNKIKNKYEIISSELNYVELYTEEAYIYDWKRYTVCSRCYYNGISKCLFKTNKPPHFRKQIYWFKTLFDDNDTYEQTKQLLNNYDISDHYFIEYNDFTQCLKKN